MQTLNVGAGQSETEYKQAGAQRRADIRADSQSDANFFFWAAGLAALGTGLLPIRLNVFVSIGTIDLLRYYGVSLGPLYTFVLPLAAAMWVAILAGLGFAARRGFRWAFLAGMALYSVDMIALVITFSFFSFGVHGIFVFKWYQGQRSLKDLNEAQL